MCFNWNVILGAIPFLDSSNEVYIETRTVGERATQLAQRNRNNATASTFEHHTNVGQF